MQCMHSKEKKLQINAELLSWNYAHFLRTTLKNVTKFGTKILVIRK